MGFDIYGLNPTIKEGSVRPTINWEAKPTKEEQKNFKRKILEIIFATMFGGGDC